MPTSERQRHGSEPTLASSRYLLEVLYWVFNRVYSYHSAGLLTIKYMRETTGIWITLGTFAVLKSSKSLQCMSQNTDQRSEGARRISE